LSKVATKEKKKSLETVATFSSPILILYFGFKKVKLSRCVLVTWFTLPTSSPVPALLAPHPPTAARARFEIARSSIKLL
jgi:hypothetical protein